MRRGGLLGLLPLLLAIAACTADSLPEPGIDLAQDVAVPAYTAPSGAPSFCARLAASVEIADVPTSIGVLVADPRDERARRRLAAARDELRRVLVDVVESDGDPAIASALEDLLAALDSLAAGRVTAERAAPVGHHLGRVGDRVQPVCRFPE